jgi:hypothetical protein
MLFENDEELLHQSESENRNQRTSTTLHNPDDCPNKSILAVCPALVLHYPVSGLNNEYIR